MTARRHFRRLALPVLASSLAVGLSLSLSACSNPLETVVEQVRDKTVSVSTDGEGKTTIGTAEVPADFPEVVPLPDRAPVTAVRDKRQDVNSWLLHYKTADGAAELDALIAAMLASGFEEESDVNMGSKMRVALVKNSEYTVTFGLLGDEGDQILQITVMDALQ